MQYKTKQFFFFLLKLAIVCGAFYFIYTKTIHNENIRFEVFIQQLEQTLFANYTAIFFLGCFTLGNWFFEVLKWKALASYCRKISISEAFQQSLGSLTASLFTPNRIGEYGAKAVYFKKGNRRKIMLLNLLSNMMQMTITVVTGSIGLVFFMTHFEVDIDLFRMRKLAYVLAFVLVLAATGKFFGFKKIRGFYLEKIIAFVKKMPVSLHALSAFYSMIRYFIFSHQFFFLLRLFGIETDYLTLMSLITSMYILASIVPSLPLFDWLIKGSVAVWLFNVIGANELIIVTTSLLMWCLNFGFPALIGSYFVLNFSMNDQK